VHYNETCTSRKRVSIAGIIAEDGIDDASGAISHCEQGPTSFLSPVAAYTTATSDGDTGILISNHPTTTKPSTGVVKHTATTSYGEAGITCHHHTTTTCPIHTAVETHTAGAHDGNMGPVTGKQSACTACVVAYATPTINHQSAIINDNHTTTNKITTGVIHHLALPSDSAPGIPPDSNTRP
jgi:hypothetical protein